MAEPQAGWYPDPSGDVTKLRYWDGVQWTESFMQNPQSSPAQEQPQAAQADSAYQQPQPAAQQPAQAYNAGQAYTQPGAYQQQGQPSYQQPQYGQTMQPQQVQVTIEKPTYPVTKEDQMLRLIAFIFCVVSIASSFWLIVPLAWMIPMTVMSWQIYKGTRANTVVFGVCTLIFVNIVSGILLLVSTKEQ